MADHDNLSASERLRRAMEASEQSLKPDAPADEKSSKSSTPEGRLIGELWNTAYLRYGFVKNAYDTIEVIFKSKIILVLTLGLSFLVVHYWRLCKRAFKWYSVNKETGTYDKKRGAIALVFLMLFTIFGVPFTARLSTEAVMIEGFSYYDTLLFSKPDLIDEAQNIWSVSSCTKYPCEGEVDTTEHRMTDSVWLDLKYFLTGRVSYDPGELKGAFNSEQNACNVRQWKRRIKVPFSITIPYILPQNGFYPNIIEANCDSVDSNNWEEIIERKRSQRKDLQHTATN